MTNPLYVMAKIGISQVPKKTFEAMRDDLHDALRRDYPSVGAISQLNEQRIEISPTGDTQVKGSTSPVLSLMNLGDGWAVRIETNAVYLHTSKYQSYNNFRERLINLLIIVNELLDITHFERVGLRYINKYKISDDEVFTAIRRTEFLQPDLNSLPKGGSNLQSVYVSGKNILSVNSGVRVDNPPLGMDLIETAQDVGLNLEILKGPYAHLDLDAGCRFKVPEVYSLDKVIFKLDELRGLAKNAYLEIVSE